MKSWPEKQGSDDGEDRQDVAQDVRDNEETFLNCCVVLFCVVLCCVVDRNFTIIVWFSGSPCWLTLKVQPAAQQQRLFYGDLGSDLHFLDLDRTLEPALELILNMFSFSPSKLSRLDWRSGLSRQPVALIIQLNPQEEIGSSRTPQF